jgi:outer membrane lipoprotein-sorting protein
MFMLLGKKILLTAALALFLAPATPNLAAQDLNSVLAKLDAASANFHSTTAQFEFDSTMTDPVPDTDIQKGTVYYDRKNGVMRMGIHIDEVNGKPIPKIIVISAGQFQLYEKMANQVTRSKKAGKYESYLALGFGASGKDLQQRFEVKYGGSDTVGGVKTEKLDLVAKDPDVLKLFPKMTIWIDPARGVCIKQFFDEGQGQSRTATFSNVKINQPQPSDAFFFKTDSKTQFVDR